MVGQTCVLSVSCSGKISSHFEAKAFKAVPTVERSLGILVIWMNEKNCAYGVLRRNVGRTWDAIILESYKKS